MKRILFVDDEARILRGLERMLRDKRHEWEMVFAVGGEEALRELQRSPFDLVISDMRMPQVDGAILLKEVRDRYPEAIRVVLSGQTEMETALRSVPVAHQFLVKPCKGDHLKEIIKRTFQLQALLNEVTLRKVIGKIDRLPVLPKVYQALIKALAQTKVLVREIAAIVEQDMALSAKVLQLVNSAFSGLPHRVTDITTAVTFIGLNHFKHLTLSVEAFRTFEGKKGPEGFSLEELRDHALLTGNIARKMFHDKQESEDAFIAGVLHDIGKLIVMVYLPEKFEQIVKAAEGNSEKWNAVERELFGVTHAEIGAYLLGIWGLPTPVVEAVANHHEPRRVPHREFDVLSAVYLADQLARRESEEKIDLVYLQELKVADRLAAWRELAQGLAVSC